MTSVAELVADRLFQASLGTMDLLSVALGDRLGLYRCMSGPGQDVGWSAGELASRTSVSHRYVAEWLEQQAVTGLVEVAGSLGERRFRLAAGVAEVLTDRDSLLFLAPLVRQLAAAASHFPAIAEGAKSGRGLSWATFGIDMRESQADLNRAGYLRLIPEWFGGLPDLQARLRSATPARVADVGCGGGWSSIGIARAYPNVEVDAFDLDLASVALARRNVAEAGVVDRVRIHHNDIADLAGADYDLVTAFECMHDLPFPVQALTAMRHVAAPNGVVLVADMKVADEFTAPADDLERLMYGFSLLICLPDSMSTPGSAATGTVMRTEAFRRYALDAGFAELSVLPIEHNMWRFYRLHLPSGTPA